MVIIHPTDSTTDFLKSVYDKMFMHNFIDGKTICTFGKHINCTNSNIKFLLNHQCFEKERIIMLGHGSEYGLFSKTNNQPRLIINSKHVEFLRKLECIGVWCNANMFAEKYNLKGLFTGMIISEMDEAYWYGINTTNEELEEENQKFAERLRYCIRNYKLNEIPIRMLEMDDKKSQLTTFNYQNIYWYE